MRYTRMTEGVTPTAGHLQKCFDYRMAELTSVRQISESVKGHAALHGGDATPEGI